jgi:hypothetical protein
MPTKLGLDIDDDTWTEVTHLKTDRKDKNLNTTAVYLIKRGLETVRREKAVKP